MALSTNADLQAAIADWLNRSDLSAQIPDFLTLAQLKINRRLSIVEQEILAEITPVAQATTLPVGTKYVISVSDSKGRRVEAVSMSELLDYAAEGGSVTRYSVSGDKIYFAPTPASDNTDAFSVLYSADKDLNGGDSGPVLLQDIYLNAALHEAYVYLKDDGRVAYFKGMVDEGVANVQARRAKQGVGRARIKDESIAANGGPLV
jgi:hypothetical protein|tara:strand:- start:6557 stop:7171 length:615 start_codon:yes stop_codon:yes gene_type:complete